MSVIVSGREVQAQVAEGDSVGWVISVKSGGVPTTETIVAASYGAKFETPLQLRSATHASNFIIDNTAKTVTVLLLPADTTGRPLGAVPHRARIKLGNGRIITAHTGRLDVIEAIAPVP